jgi:putative toxin-antitoxin system antitoxin component (TIGR02293 family)
VKKYKAVTDQKTTLEEPMASYTISSSMPGHLFYSKHKVAPQDFSGKLNLVKKGITRQALNELMEMTGLSLSELASFMHMTERTLRNYAPDTRLGAEPSERALEIALLYERGKDVFHSLDLFKKYMDGHISALGFKKPKEFLDTSMGIAYIMDELGRMQHGVYS